ncbi:pyruvate dehydrogenase complex E1 component subunit beta [Leptospira sp. 2 VSF19]|uniref:Pyruvate dehydrogenase complex E1 component subunit beta n=1 Tax=Leptospira soteropolitanensis TaxID=2950025 RepID=A0AAW5VDL0_9LEPT|nr:pyruvate dehydrogenase complex E1 component subunit beta [Leptospira soteropolitanensis]MCW7492326.1 pyruvate dehydrogenase complex E1 component subunit beta [Leptospira soteropolitanensis]MCW7499908.1 pyruvate dehydrogenase complex E1 component subunit beta [Leptospira soteropolitanensis]MCW7522159.1 pyruvate dehydrogenase complex E1 component subunit beta [Leptospira soteropolitanensis]MCW7526013.1 pyruvate dehydrogenase complex E1 component subunit beta [Leptospira soteropolitanensis]MCW
MAILTYREALNRAMVEEMEKDPLIYLMGEEVGHYQGAYKVSQGMLEKFGEERVIDTPISENGFAGIGVGSAMVGLRPIIEFMTWNFSLVAIDQIINSAAKMNYMSGGQFPMPIVFRGAGGAGGRLGAQHSQAFESWYAHCPGLKVVCPATPKDAYGLLKSSIRDNNPTIFIESEVLYGSKGEVPEQEYTIPLGLGEIKRKGTDITLVTWSRALGFAEEAALILEKEGISVEIVDLRSLRPLDENLIYESVKKTNRAVVVEEGWPVAGFGAQIAYLIQKNAFAYLDHPVERVTQMDVPMSYAANLERMSLPNATRVADTIREILQ